ncbi:hypothetical protein [Luteolibacter luteus]|uniref:Uncharacterized protein n=1 Tax=Luteolibacter luteus TaxID=2728835 RepID=A0A858RN45_9BACT|nr:hypothetical protein [Luteolibacter luteus]QJE98427.1 hypothetical protein HHL09_22445 [Luteolibacter luteus]
MKARTATIAIISLLLGMSALSVGGRLYVDAQASKQSSGQHPRAKARKAESTPLPSVPAGQTKAPPLEGDGLIKQLQALMAIGNEADRTQGVLELVSHFKPEDWQRALSRETLQMMSKPGPTEAGSIADLIIAAWTEVDPEAAMEWSGAQGYRGFRVITAWIGKDPDAALDYLRDHMKNGNDGNVTAMVGKAIDALGDDLPRIARAIREVPEDCREFGPWRAQPQFGNLQPGDIKAFLDSLDPPFKFHGLDLLLRGLKDHEARLAVLREYPDAAQPWSYHPIYKEWPKSDLPAARQSVEQMEAGEAREAALRGLLTGLAREDDLSELFSTMRRFLDDISEEQMADLIAGAASNDNNRSGVRFIPDEAARPATPRPTTRNAAIALAEVPGIQSEALREQLYRHIIEGWLVEDRNAAKEWLGRNELPERLRKEFGE